MNTYIITIEYDSESSKYLGKIDDLDVEVLDPIKKDCLRHVMAQGFGVLQDRLENDETEFEDQASIRFHVCDDNQQSN